MENFIFCAVIMPSDYKMIKLTFKIFQQIYKICNGCFTFFWTPDLLGLTIIKFNLLIAYKSTISVNEIAISDIIVFKILSGHCCNRCFLIYVVGIYVGT